MNMTGLTTHKIMSENKVVLLERKTKEVKLPESGATIIIYASVIAKDLGGINVTDVKEKNPDNITDAIKLMSRLIKSWNVYATKDSDKPLEINEESVGQLPINDITFLLTELEQFITSEKKE